MQHIYAVLCSLHTVYFVFYCGRTIVLLRLLLLPILCCCCCVVHAESYILYLLKHYNWSVDTHRVNGCLAQAFTRGLGCHPKTAQVTTQPTSTLPPIPIPLFSLSY